MHTCSIPASSPSGPPPPPTTTCCRTSRPWTRTVRSSAPRSSPPSTARPSPPSRCATARSSPTPSPAPRTSSACCASASPPSPPSASRAGAAPACAACASPPDVITHESPRSTPWSTPSRPTSPPPTPPTSPGPARRPRDTGHVSTRVTSSRLIGRTTELQQLEDALADASTGRPSLAFVAGDSGVGKTRLVNELRHRAETAGAEVLSGDAVELGEGELPYAALVSALRPLARDGHPALEALEPSARAELARLLPGLAGAGPLDGDAGASQSRLFEALLALLDRIGAGCPVVLVL